MTYEFTYWDNTLNPPKMIFQCVVPSKIEADLYFKRIIGNHPDELENIECKIKKLVFINE